MTKEALVKGLKKVAGSDKARLFADVIRDIIVEGLTSDGIVKIKGLGTFKVVEVKARKSVDVNTGAEIEIAAHKKVTFTPENQLADEVNEPLANLPIENIGEVVTEVKTPEKKPIAKKETAEKPKKSAKKMEPVAAIEKSQVVEEEKSKDDEAIKKLGEDAESLKGILAMINGPINEKTISDEKISDEPVQPEPVIAEQPVQPVQPVAPQPVVSQPVQPVQPVIAPQPEQPVQPVIPQPVQAPVGPQPIDLGPAPVKRGIRGWHVVVIVVVTLLLAGGVACLFIQPDFIFNRGDKNEVAKVEESAAKSEERRKAEMERIKAEAQEMGEDDDSIYVYTGVTQLVKPAQHQSDDNALAVIRVKEGDRLMSLSKQYYGHKMFWVYIYEANKANLRSPNDLQLNMRLVIPKLDPKLTDVENEESVAAAMKMEAKYLGK